MEIVMYCLGTITDNKQSFECKRGMLCEIRQQCHSFSSRGSELSLMLTRPLWLRFIESIFTPSFSCCSVLKQKNGLTKVTEVCSSAGARQKKSVAVVWQTVIVKAQSILSDSSQPPAPRVSDLAFRFSRVKYPKAKAKTYGHSFSPSDSSPLNSDRIR